MDCLLALLSELCTTPWAHVSRFSPTRKSNRFKSDGYIFFFWKRLICNYFLWTTRNKYTHTAHFCSSFFESKTNDVPFSLERFFLSIILLLFLSLARSWYWNFSTFIRFYPYLFAYPITVNIDVHNGNISNFLSVIFTVSFSFFVFFASNSNRKHLCFGRAKIYYLIICQDQLMNAISIELYILSVYCFHITISYLFQTARKYKKRFLLLLLLLLLLFCSSHDRHVLRALEAYVKVESNVIKFSVTIGFFSKENDWPLIDIESSLFLKPLRGTIKQHVYFLRYFYYYFVWLLWSFVVNVVSMWFVRNLIYIQIEFVSKALISTMKIKRSKQMCIKFWAYPKYISVKIEMMNPIKIPNCASVDDDSMENFVSRKFT